MCIKANLEVYLNYKNYTICYSIARVIFFYLRYLNAVFESCYTILVAKTLVVAFYIVLVTVQRYHLFVWTVFSPKLLYEASSAAVTVLTLLVCLITTVSVTGRHKSAID